MKEIDARGLACPAPVLLTKAAIEKEGADYIKVTVDNKASKENLCLFFESKKFETIVKQKGDDFQIIGKLKEGEILSTETPPEVAEESPATKGDKTMIMVATSCIGHGDDELGSKLMINFLKTLNEMGRDLWRLVFVNSGVKLCIEGAEVLPVLKELEQSGIHILVCGTCLNHFNILEKKEVGETTNMLDIVTAMQLADKVINI